MNQADNDRPVPAGRSPAVSEGWTGGWTGDGRQLALPFTHRPRFDRSGFIAAPSNREALAWLHPSAGAWPDGRLALWGEAGIGKTHLLHVWAHERGGVLLPATALRRPEDGLSCAVGAAAIAVDDADEAPSEPALLHLLNEAGAAGAPLLLAGRLPPARWPVSLPDLQSRLRATTAVRLNRPDELLLRVLLQRLLGERQMALPPAALDWMLRRLPRTADAMRDATRRLDEAALASGRGVSRALMAEALAGLLVPGPEPDEAAGTADPEPPSLPLLG